jgi:hypothetical protein
VAERAAWAMVLPVPAGAAWPVLELPFSVTVLPIFSDCSRLTATISCPWFPCVVDSFIGKVYQRKKPVRDRVPT